MIDRGDLYAELGQKDFFNYVKTISETTKKYGKPLIMATDNMTSMMKDSVPSKGDLISLGYSNFIGADRIMLSEETAVNKNYLKVLKTLKRILQNNKYNKYPKTNSENIFWTALKNIPNNQSLIIFTKKGFAIDKIRYINPQIKLFIFTDNVKTYNSAKLRSNIEIFQTKKFNNKNLEKFIYNQIKKNKKVLFKKNKELFILRITYPRKNSRANNLALISKADF